MSSASSSTRIPNRPAKRPRVVVFFDHTAQLSGGEIVLLRMATHLDRARWTPVVVLGSEGALREALEAADIETHVFPLDERVVQTRKDSLGGSTLLKARAAWQLWTYSRRLAKFLRKRRANLLHTNSLKGDIVGALAAKIARVPLVWHIHDRIEPDYLPAKAVMVLRWLCARVPRAVIANSQATLQTLHLPQSKRATVIYPGVPLDEIASDESASEAESASDDKDRVLEKQDTPRVGMVGRIARWKGQHVFLEAAVLVRAQSPNVQFTIVGAPLFGEEEYEKQVRAQCTQLGLDDGVTWTGFCDDVASHVRTWNVQVHASTVPEPFGQVVVEAMALGKPVVATDGGGVPEIVIHNETGLLVPMNDARALGEAVLQVLRDPDSAHAMGQRGRARVVECFTAPHMARQLESFYDEVV